MNSRIDLFIIESSISKGADSLEILWSTNTLYHGIWARMFMPRKRFQALLSFLHVVDPRTEDGDDRLRKLRYLLDAFKETCRTLFNARCQV